MTPWSLSALCASEGWLAYHAGLHLRRQVWLRHPTTVVALRVNADWKHPVTSAAQ
jgi:hypothetical protein